MLRKDVVPEDSLPDVTDASSTWPFDASDDAVTGAWVGTNVGTMVGILVKVVASGCAVPNAVGAS